MNRFLLPLVIFLSVIGFLWVGLYLNPREVPSPLVGKPAPSFNLPQLQNPEKMLSPNDMLGQVWLFNVWASWCVSCRDEHPLFMELAKSGTVPVIGMNYKDNRDDAVMWLSRGGNPYVVTVVDADGRTGIDYGVYGVPETYVIDKTGVIAYKQIGVVTDDVLRANILPLVKKLQAQ